MTFILSGGSNIDHRITPMKRRVVSDPNFPAVININRVCSTVTDGCILGINMVDYVDGPGGVAVPFPPGNERLSNMYLVQQRLAGLTTIATDLIQFGRWQAIGPPVTSNAAFNTLSGDAPNGGSAQCEVVNVQNFLNTRRTWSYTFSAGTAGVLAGQWRIQVRDSFGVCGAGNLLNTFIINISLTATN